MQFKTCWITIVDVRGVSKHDRHCLKCSKEFERCIVGLAPSLPDVFQTSEACWITHDIATVRAISDQVVVMSKGEVVEQGKKTVVFSPPHPAYTELLLSSVPEMDPDWLTNLTALREVN